MPPLRLIKAPPVAARAPRSGWLWKPLKRYSIRVVAGMLLISIPLSVALGLVISSWSTQTYIDQAKARGEATAESAAVRIGDWVVERQAELRILAQDQSGTLGSSDVQAQLRAEAASHPSFETLQVFDASGRVVASSVPGVTLSATPSGGTFANSMSVETIGPVEILKGELDWLITAPILGANEQPQGVVVGDINLTSLESLLNPYGADAVTSSTHNTSSSTARSLARSPMTRLRWQRGR
jgi:hypothetical protein